MRRSVIGLVVLVLVAINLAGSPARAVGPTVVRDGEAARAALEATGGAQPDTNAEPSIAVNPEDPLNVVTVYQAGRFDTGGAQYNGYATTFDGGVTWESGPLPKLTKATGGTTYDRASDPVVAFGPGGQLVYALSLLAIEVEPEFGVFKLDLGFSVSRDAGRTWSDPILVGLPEQAFPLDDKPWFAVDTGTGPGHEHPGRIYLVWSAGVNNAAMYSDDEAQTWHGPYEILGAGSGLLPLVLPDGALGVVSVNGGNLNLACSDSTAGDEYLFSIDEAAGEIDTGDPLVFGPPSLIATGCYSDVLWHREGDGLPTTAVDPRTGTIYVSWTDTRFRTDGVHDIVVVNSTSDDGRDWSRVRRVNPGATNDYLSHFTPSLAVGADGIVRISYRTHQQAENEADFSFFVDTIYQQSSDVGRNWSAPLKVNQTPSDVRFAAMAFVETFYGDYNQIAVAGSWAYVVRAESFQLVPLEPATWPPSSHHQRTWVALIDSDGDGSL